MSSKNMKLVVGALTLALTVVLGAVTAPAQSMFQQAREGDPQAQTKLGVAYLSGSGVARDYRQALAWLGRAAAQNHAPAQYLLGTMYEEGRGMPRNYGKAFLWYLAAARQGHAKSQWEVGRFFYEGYAVKVDYTKAFAWWQKAAAQGHPDARYAVDHQRPPYEERGGSLGRR